MAALICSILFSSPFNQNFFLIVQPDTNFKSIHQLQTGEHKMDTINNKSATGFQSERAMINFALIILIIILFIFFATIFLIARRIYLTKK